MNMKRKILVLTLAALIADTRCRLAAEDVVSIQTGSHVVGTGDKAWHYLILEGEDYNSKLGENLAAGFTRVDNSAGRTNALGNPVLGKDTTASKKGALFTQTTFGQHTDKVTYKVQFAKAGTYYLYMRFTLFENGGNPANYLNEDSFYVPPDFGKDPQTDWPLSDRGGYTEGCCDGGFLTIREKGLDPVTRNAGDDAGRAYWEGNFHWNELSSSQFLNAETQGQPRLRFRYEVKADQVGKPLDFTISYREGGVTVDLFLFSTNPDLMSQFTHGELDQTLLGGVAAPSLVAAKSGNNVRILWPGSTQGYVLESSSAVAGAPWTAVTTVPQTSGDQQVVTVDGSSGVRFYRLRKP